MSATTPSTSPAVSLDDPRSPYHRKKITRTNFELYGWMFMRISGAILIVLIFGHLFVNLMVGRGVHAIDFAFVGGKWSNPMWQIWDLLMLWLAMLHGTNGVRTIVNDYAQKPLLRVWLKVLLYAASIAVITLGTLVIFTFEPCPVGADPDLLSSICTGG